LSVDMRILDKNFLFVYTSVKRIRMSTCGSDVIVIYDVIEH